MYICPALVSNVVTVVRSETESFKVNIQVITIKFETCLQICVYMRVRLSLKVLAQKTMNSNRQWKGNKGANFTMKGVFFSSFYIFTIKL